MKKEDLIPPADRAFLIAQVRTLQEKWRKRAINLTSDYEVMRDDRVKALILNECADDLDALLLVLQQEEKEGEATRVDSVPVLETARGSTAAAD